MPLHVRRRKDTGDTLYITGVIVPAGSNQRYRVRKRAGSDDEALAREEAAAIEREILRTHHLGARPTDPGFAAAATSYIQAEARSTQTVQSCMKLVRHFGSTPLSQINQVAIDNARAVILRDGAGPGTVRRNLIVPVRAVLNHAARRGWCDVPRFELPREPKGRTEFLLPGEFEAICAAAQVRVQPLLRYLVCTGCRLGETLALDWSQVDLQGQRVRLWADQTKAGAERTVALMPGAVVALAGLPGPRTGHVFRSRLRGDDGELLPYAPRDVGGGGQINTGLATACRVAGVRRITAHALRHTFATWHYALHRDLLALQRAGGWESIDLVTRYAHLAPVGIEDGVRRVWGLGTGLAVVKGRDERVA